MRYSITNAIKRRDERGFLVDFLKGDEVDNSDSKLGQIYLVTFDKKKIIRGNHYHKNKKEWFVAIKGKLQVVLEDLKTKECKEFILDGDSDEYERISIEENVAHAFKSITNEAMMINYSNKSYHKDNPDTFFYKLL